MGENHATNRKQGISDIATAVSRQNDSRFGVPPPRRGDKSGFTGPPPWRPGKTTVVWGSRCRVRVIKALLPGSRRRVQAKRQPFRGASAVSGVKKRFCRVAAAAPGQNDNRDGVETAASRGRFKRRGCGEPAECPRFPHGLLADLMRTPQGCQVVIPKGSVPICGGARALARFNALIALNGEAA